MRYKGQNHELSIAVPNGKVGETLLAELRQGFERQHEQMYGYAAPEEPIEAVTFRIEAIGAVRQARIEPRTAAGYPLGDALMVKRDVWLAESGRFLSCPVYDREKLGPRHRIEGPAIIEQMDATTFVLPGQTATVDAYLNMILEG
jgi:N-methylhydantoinase A